MNMIKEIDVDDIMLIWKTKLWPNRTSSIRTHSAMMFDPGKYDMGNFLLENWYHGCYVNNLLIGVNSGHLCTDGSVRSRGLWVYPEYRQNGYGKQLLRATIDESKIRKAISVWSYPRKTSWSTYKGVGFTLSSDWAQSETSEANAYCFLKIDNSELL